MKHGRRFWIGKREDDYRLPPGRDGLAVVRNIAQWIIDYKADLSGLDFPFDRPYLSFFNRCMVALRAIDAFLRIPPNDKHVVRMIRRLGGSLRRFLVKCPFVKLSNSCTAVLLYSMSCEINCGWQKNSG